MSLKDLKIIATDPLKKDYILPQKVIWTSAGVENAEILLTSEIGQAFQGQKNAAVLSTKNNKKGAIILDFGSELTGGVRIVTGERDWSKNRNPLVRIRFGESVTEAMTPIGVKNATNDHGTRDFCIPLALLSATEWGNTGFRFVYIELEELEYSLQLVSVHAVFTHRDVEQIGSFCCSDELINEIYKTACHTAHLNMQALLIEGAKRDRMVWNGDTFIAVPSIHYIYGEQDVIADTLRFVANTVKLPNYWNNMQSECGSFFRILDRLYRFTGSTALANELKFYWKPMLKHYLTLINDKKPYVAEEKISWIFFDWTTEGNIDASRAGVQTNFLISFKSAANICRLTDEMELYDECTRKVKLLSEDNINHFDNFALSTVMYYAGILDANTTAKIYKKHGIKNMFASKAHMILNAMAQTIGTDYALNILREYYGAMIKVGATSFWEFFDVDWVHDGAAIDKLHKEGEYDIHADNGKHCYEGLRNSLCHVWGASPIAFLTETILGVTVLEPGCKKLSVKPELADLDWVKGTYPTPYGVVEIEAKRVKGEIVTNIKAPKQIEIVR